MLACSFITDSMKTKYEIVAELANDKAVEQIVANITHMGWNADLDDLSQIVYLALLEYPEDKIQDLYENRQMVFFLVRIVLNQFRSGNSPFHYQIRKFQQKSLPISIVKDKADE